MLLKLIAIISMLIDHAGILLFNDNYIMRLIGRLAFPLFAYFIVDNYLHNTRNKKRYIEHIYLLAMVSQIPFYMSGIDHIYYLNILFLLFIGLIQIAALEHREDYYHNTLSGEITKINWVLLITPLSITIAYFSEYGLAGYALILSIYFMLKYRDNLFYKFLVVLALLVNLQSVFWIIIPLYLYLIFSGVDKLIPYNKRYKYLFYIFYPVHLVLLTLISSFL